MFDFNYLFNVRFLYSCMAKIIRPSWDDTYFAIAREMALRGTCIRRIYGAVAVTQDHVPLSTGYCGAPRGVKNCSDLEVCLREKLNVPSGERYELCRSAHAEMNVFLNAAREGTAALKGTILYVYGLDAKDRKTPVNAQPCKLCRRTIINAGVIEVVYNTPDGVKRELVSDWVKRANEDPFGGFI